MCDSRIFQPSPLFPKNSLLVINPVVREKKELKSEKNILFILDTEMS